MQTYSCVIPIYNEATRILDVLRPIRQIKEIKQIICIDDGSTDDSFFVIKENFPKITLICHPKNLGKTEAIRTGLQLAKNDGILLLDSDLLDVQSREIRIALITFEKHRLDCLLLNTTPTNFAEQLIRPFCRFLLLAAGNRVVRKQWIKDLLNNENVRGYDLEIAQNKYLMERNMKVAYIDVSARDVSKIEKIGLIKGWLEELKMWYQIVTYAGIWFFIKQSLFFARKKLPEL